jgi:hypothetical protein
LKSEKNPGCLVNWIDLGDSCFRFFIRNVRSWNTARQVCRRLGGDLAKSEDLKALLNHSDTLLKLFEGFDYGSNQEMFTADRILWVSGVTFLKDGSLKCGTLLVDKNETPFDTCSMKRSFVCQVSRGKLIEVL